VQFAFVVSYRSGESVSGLVVSSRIRGRVRPRIREASDFLKEKECDSGRWAKKKKLTEFNSAARKVPT